MSPSTMAILIVFLVFIWYLFTTASKPKHKSKLPPGPSSLPIIGNLHMLGSLPHRSLQHLAKRYGPIMSIHLGNVPVIVVSSPKAAELFLKTHDHNFANRPKTKVSQCMTNGAKDLAFV
ncbi:putative indoleacetaldoxime dehydratase [Rosa chinensis]|uniref:Putative indoleacetaldoxime dehydratase n=1 Tax=Rosa chinensis TaxID=74649 RepID=A0A2P6QXB8_ROSCH|nr:putative indoleacetaldoxime dehydratase [Rosa chinensis]